MSEKIKNAAALAFIGLLMMWGLYSCAFIIGQGFSAGVAP